MKRKLQKALTKNNEFVNENGNENGKIKETETK